MSNLQAMMFSSLIAVIASAIVVLVVYIRRTTNSKVVGDAMSLLTALAGTLVLSAADEVRNLKDPLQPGQWTQEEAKRIKDRVMADLQKFGANTITQLKDLNSLSKDDVAVLLDRLVEQQVEVLRLQAKHPNGVLPSG